MPAGMFLRSGSDWHLDPEEKLTLRRYIDEHGGDEPVSLNLFLDYAAWFQNQAGVEVIDERVTTMAHTQDRFVAQLSNVQTIHSPRVVLCTGFRPFPNLNHPLAGREGVHHTNDFVDLKASRGEKVMVVGGRQAAFEWAALLAECGAEAVHVVHRHPTPAFASSDWTWIEPFMEEAERIPGWFAGLASTRQDELRRRFWEEGRAKLEPWLQPRLERPEVTLWPETEVTEWDGETARLSQGTDLLVDRVILATGFRMQLERLGFLCGQTVLPKVETRDGFPVLSSQFESSLPGLYFTSFASTQQFGPFFGFVRGCPTTARILLPA
jgi:thioredoxin reductase